MKDKKTSNDQKELVTPKVFSQSEIKQFRESLSGNLYLPGDDKYEEAKKTWALYIENKPSVIIEINDTTDVTTAINFAKKHQLFIAVQSTGHGASHPCDGHMLIKTNLMHHFSIDVESQTLTTEAGATWEEITAESQKSGLVPLTGFAANVGVTGYVIGGGFGWLVRKYGLAVDHLLSFNMVSLEGELKTVSATENEDLFWGICGGGNFGIITSLTMKLFPLKSVLASQFYYPGSQAKQVLELYRSIVENFPEELTSAVSVMHLPPNPALPEAIRKKFVVSVKAIYQGDEDKGKELLAPFKNLQRIYEQQETLPYEKASKISGDPQAPQKVYGHVEILNKLTQDLTDILSNLAVGNVSVKPVIEIIHISGAMAKVPVGKNAFGHRNAKFILHVEVPLAADNTQAAAADYIHSLSEAVRPYSTGGTYLNFIGNVDTDEELVKSAFNEDDYTKLRLLKFRYDPGNILRFNFNIPPAKVYQIL